MTTTVSSVYFAAAIAAERELPPASRAVLDTYDHENRAWMRAGCPSPHPVALVAAGEALRADPLASAAIAIRRLGNAAYAEERHPAAAAT